MKGTIPMNMPCRNPNAPLCYNFPWGKLTDELYPSVIREYLDWGVDTFVMSEDLLGRCSKGPDGLAFVKRLADEFHVKFVSTHGFAGQYIIVFPEKDAVLVLTTSSSLYQPYMDLIWQYLLPVL